MSKGNSYIILVMPKYQEKLIAIIIIIVEKFCEKIQK